MSVFIDWIVETTTYPCRTNSYKDFQDRDVFHHYNLQVDNYWETDYSSHDYEHIIFQQGEAV